MEQINQVPLRTLVLRITLRFALILGVILGDKNILVYGFAISVVYAGVMRIITAFRKTAIVYIQ